MKRKKSPILHHKSSSGEGSDTPRTTGTPGSGASSSTTHGTSHHHTPNILPPSATLNVSPHITIHSSNDDLCVLEEIIDNDGHHSSGSLPSLGSNEGLHLAGLDEADGASSNAMDLARTRAAIDHIQLKIIRTKELIKIEQTNRDENVNEYLKLATNADKQQLQRIKSVFEKKNQKSAQTIVQLQKKLENYNKRIRDLEIHGLPRGVLRDVGQGLKDVRANIKGGISGLSGGMVGNIKGGLSGLSAVTHTAAETVMSKPRELAHLIKNKFGSADNINSMGKAEENHEDVEKNFHGSALSTHSTRYTSDEESSSAASESGQLTVPQSSTGPPPVPPASPYPHSNHHCFHYGMETGASLGTTTLDLEPILQELRSQREEYQHLVEEIDSLKNQIQHECSFFGQALQEERYRCERLEEQMNDLIELHQNEIENLKQGIADMEEKVQYQSEERLRDVHDILDSCQTRISRMEHQQHQHLQQLVTLDNFENSQARALLLKLVNVVLTVLQVVLLLVATVSNIVMPFLRTRVRTLTTGLFLLMVIFICHQWPGLFEYCQRKSAEYISSFQK